MDARSRGPSTGAPAGFTFLTDRVRRVNPRLQRNRRRAGSARKKYASPPSDSIRPVSPAPHWQSQNSIRLCSSAKKAGSKAGLPAGLPAPPQTIFRHSSIVSAVKSALGRASRLYVRTPTHFPLPTSHCPTRTSTPPSDRPSSPFERADNSRSIPLRAAAPTRSRSSPDRLA